MKKLTLLFAVLLIAAGGYTGLWFSNANLLKNEAQNGIKTIELFTGQLAIDSSNLSTAGYPSSVGVRYNNPKINVPGAFKLDADYVQITRGIHSNSISLSLQNYNFVSFGQASQDAKPVEMTYKSSSSDTTTFTFEGSNLKDFITLSMSFNPFKGKTIGWELLDSFRSLNTQSSGGELVDKNTGDLYYKLGPIQFKLDVNRLDENSHKISLNYSLNDVEFTPAFDKLVQDFVNQSFVKSLAQNDSRLSALNLDSINLSGSGKLNTEADITYEGFTNVNSDSAGEFNLQINNFKQSNDLANSHIKGTIKGQVNQGEKGISQASLTLEGSYKASPAMNDYIKNVFLEQVKRQILSQANTLSNPGADNAIASAQMTIAMLDFLGPQLLPDFHAFGEVKYNADIDYNKDLSDIRDLTINTDKGGLSLKGQFKRDSKNELSTFDLKLTILNYEKFFDSLTDYLFTLTKVYNESAGTPLDEKASEVRKEVLAMFKKEMIEGGTKDGENLLLSISFDGVDYKLGNMPMIRYGYMLGSLLSGV